MGTLIFHHQVQCRDEQHLRKQNLAVLTMVGEVRGRAPEVEAFGAADLQRDGVVAHELGAQDAGAPLVAPVPPDAPVRQPDEDRYADPHLLHIQTSDHAESGWFHSPRWTAASAEKPWHVLATTAAATSTQPRWRCDKYSHNVRRSAVKRTHVSEYPHSRGDASSAKGFSTLRRAPGSGCSTSRT